MSDYNFKKAKKIIEKYKKQIVSADYGMSQDWFWTAQEIWNKKDGFLIDLDTVTKIGGISGSVWDTPELKLFKKDGTYIGIACSKKSKENNHE